MINIARENLIFFNNAFIDYYKIYNKSRYFYKKIKKML